MNKVKLVQIAYGESISDDYAGHSELYALDDAGRLWRKEGDGWDAVETPEGAAVETETEISEELCDRHGQNMATKMCYGVEYVQHELERIANAFERIAAALEDKN